MHYMAKKGKRKKNLYTLNICIWISRQMRSGTRQLCATASGSTIWQKISLICSASRRATKRKYLGGPPRVIPCFALVLCPFHCYYYLHYLQFLSLENKTLKLPFILTSRHQTKRPSWIRHLSAVFHIVQNK